MLITVLTSFGVLLLLAAGFGAAGALARRRYGIGAVLALWAGAAVLLAAVGTARNVSLQRGHSFQPAVRHPAWIFGLFAATFFLMFAPASALLARRARTARAGALGAALLLIPGILLAAAVGIALDIGGVHFLPTR